MYTEKSYIMWLSSVPNISTDDKFKLIDYFGSATDIYNMSKKDIISSGVVKERIAENIIKSKNNFDIDKEIYNLEKLQIKYYTYLDDKFPYMLRHMQNPPLGLYVWGELPDENRKNVSIVGTRKASEYGAIVCRKLSGELAQAGVNIVSGMAYGIDSHAHKACIEAGGKTIAVLGTGADICYPASNRLLRDSIVQNGCVVSEFPLGTRSSKYNFPYRNRIIACMSSAVIVVEGESKSGTLITANYALDNGRTVMAVPGNITSSLSATPNSLIADGCQPVLSTQDILDELGIKVQKNVKQVKDLPELSDNEKKIFDLMSNQAITVDEICIKSNMNIELANSILMMLELKGCIMKLTGQKYVLKI